MTGTTLELKNNDLIAIAGIDRYGQLTRWVI
jgi:hypothetical protein